MKTLSIVIPVFNKSDLTDRCLDALKKNSSRAHQITIIDNNSTDNTAQILREWSQKFNGAGWDFNIIHNPQNVGFGRAMNQGAKASSGTYLALLNNDIWLLPNLDLNLQQTMEADPELALAFPFVDESRPFEEARLLEKGSVFQNKNKNRKRKAFTGVLMFFRKNVFDQLGGFDERFFVTYEDTDLRVRMDKAGMKYRMIGDCFIWHQSMSTRGDKNLMPSNYELDSRAKFIEKWGFDFADKERTQKAKWRRRWVRFLNRWGYL